MFRKPLLYLSNQPRIFRFVRNNRLANAFARRFVPGETVEKAVAAVRVLNASRIACSIDILGESVEDEREARGTVDAYLDLLDRINDERLDSHVSLKLTALGLDIDRDVCVSHLRLVVERAAAQGTFVRIDMEGSDYTDVTLEIFEQGLQPSYPAHVGIVLQSALRRTTQ